MRQIVSLKWDNFLNKNSIIYECLKQQKCEIMQKQTAETFKILRSRYCYGIATKTEENTMKFN